MNALPIPKLSPLIRMLGSPNDGECLNAARAIGRTLKAVGRDFHDLVTALEETTCCDRRGTSTIDEWSDGPPRVREISRTDALDWIRAILIQGKPTDWERQFLTSMRDDGPPRTQKQIDVMNRIFLAAWTQGVRP